MALMMSASTDNSNDEYNDIMNKVNELNIHVAIEESKIVYKTPPKKKKKKVKRKIRRRKTITLPKTEDEEKSCVDDNKAEVDLEAHPDTKDYSFFTPFKSNPNSEYAQNCSTQSIKMIQTKSILKNSGGQTSYEKIMKQVSFNAVGNFSAVLQQPEERPQINSFSSNKLTESESLRRRRKSFRMTKETSSEVKCNVGRKIKIIKTCEIIETILICTHIIISCIENSICEDSDIATPANNSSREKSLIYKDILRCINLVIAFLLVLTQVYNCVKRFALRSIVAQHEDSIDKMIAFRNHFDKSFANSCPVSFSVSTSNNNELETKINLSPVFAPSYPILVLKIALYILTSPPFCDLTITGSMLDGKFKYTLDGVLMLLGFLKLIFLINAWMVFSKWSSRKYKKMIEEAGAVPSLAFLIKLEIKHNLFKFSIF